MSLKNLIVVAGLVLVTTIYVGCVDVPDKAPEFPDFRTQTRFIQADPALGSAQITVDGSGVATVNYQEASEYLNLPAGNRVMAVSGETQSVALESDGKVTVVVFPKESPTATRFRVYRERRTFDALVDTVAQIRFINAGLEADGSIVPYNIIDMADSSNVVLELSFRQNSGYLNLKAGSYKFGVRVSGTEDVVTTADVTVANGERHTAVIFGEQASLTLKPFKDD